MTPTLLLPASQIANELAEAIALDPKQFWGIPVALIGAALMSFGAQYQSRGLNKVERLTGESAGSGPVSYTHLDVYKRQARARWVASAD